jgi:hypothetical protein
MKTGLLKILRGWKENNRSGLNRRLSVFLICVLISAIFWFLTALSKNYTSLINFPVVYINMPEDKVLTRKMPNHLSLELNARGFSLLAYHLRFFRDSVYVDVSNLNLVRLNGNYYEGKIPTVTKINKIAAQFSSEIKLQRVYPDTLYFSFGNKTSKEVPIKLNYSITFEKQFRLYDRIIFSPASISIEGLETLIDSIQVIETDSVIFENLNQSLSIDVPIMIPEKYSSLSFSQQIINVTIPVEKYTEASVEIPIEVANLPEELSIKLFPETVTLTYIVGFSDFSKVNNQLFSARVDFSKRDNTNRLSVELIQFPEFIQPLKHSPTKVEYIIRKK